MNTIGNAWHVGSLLLLLSVGLAGCGGESDTLFERLPAERTGIDFTNTIVENDSLLNPIAFEYVYNGGGVAVGDFDGDGRDDLYFAGNVVENRLYLNRGDFRFDDVTQAAGVAAPEAWSTGVATVDINQDGLLDLYVSVGGLEGGAARANRLFVNQGLGAGGVPRFREQAAQYGIADQRYTTQASFFDYDKDGDLDLFLLVNAGGDSGRNHIRPRVKDGTAPTTDRLYRNNGDGTFADVSDEAGITVEGHGLGLVVSDINQDGWPDVYCANDFISNDLLYINNGDGTFTNRIGAYLKHQALNGMGADVADFNNDGRPDIVVMDMLPPDNKRQKMMRGLFDYNTFGLALRTGYEPQYMRNMLQVNNGPNPDGQITFSEIGQLAGVYNTDWSWAPLLADFDNDGRKDLFVTNGYGKDVTNLDHIEFGEQSSNFGTKETREARAMAAMDELPEVKLRNAIFRNEGGFSFADKTEAWGMGPPSLSNGAAFADLDQDGDLDLVTNNIDDQAFVLRNRTIEAGADEAGADEAQREAAGGTPAGETPTGGNYLRVALRGPEGNRQGHGAKIRLLSSGQVQYHEHSPYRGYKSTVEGVAHFGVGAARVADSVSVVWPDGRRETRTGVRTNQVLTLSYADARQPAAAGDPPMLAEDALPPPERLMREVAQERGLGFAHEEFEIADFRETPLLPHKHSQNGPGIAVGDADGNGLDDVFVGGDIRQPRSLFLQTASGRFSKRTLPMDSSAYEDMGALFFDVEQDGDQDLYVVSGSNVGPDGSVAYQDRLYVNDGAGGFQRDAAALPEMRTSGSVVTASDFDRDGDLDLFVGGRVRPGNYPLPARSYLLRNDSEAGRPRFTDVTPEAAPALAEVGLVTDALWTDFSGDNRADLLVVGEWMPITFFENQDGRLVDVTEETGMPDTHGWWNSLASADFDRDGDLDYVAGNLGLNTKYEASPSEPVRIYAKDFDENGELDPVLTRYIQGVSYPSHGRMALINQINAMRRRFSNYTTYAEASFAEVFTREELEGALVREAVRFETSYLENKGDGTFALRALPVQAQFAPVYGMAPGYYDEDEHLDLLMVGNSYAPDVNSGRADASVGVLLKGDGTGQFAPVDMTQSGFFVDGDAKSLAEVATGEASALMLVTQNGGPLEAFSKPSRTRHVTLQPDERYALLTLVNGQTRKEEFYYGSTYLSQSSRVLHLTESVQQAVIYKTDGSSRTVRAR